MTGGFTKPDWIPKGVIVRRGWYKHRPYLGKESGKPVFGPEQFILEIGCTKNQFFEAFDKLTNKKANTLNWLLEKYHASSEFQALSKLTQQDYERFRNQMGKMELIKDRKVMLLGDMKLNAITKPMMKSFLNAAKAKVAANRKIQYLGGAWTWGKDYFEQIPDVNPFHIRKNKETPRSRYIQDWEYAIVFHAAKSLRVPVFAPAMELSYLCRARRGEVFNLQTYDLREDGLYLCRSKGSISEITLYSDRLLEAIRLCREIHPKAPTPINGGYLLHTKDGMPYSKNALDTAWRRVMAKAKKEGAILPDELIKKARTANALVRGKRVYLSESFTFHDIKAKGVTDHRGENAGQHRTKKMEAVYHRMPKTFEPTR